MCVRNGTIIICDFSFEDCHDIINVDIPCGVKCIGSCAFYDCDNLSYVKIPNSVISIGDCAFMFCDLDPQLLDFITEKYGITALSGEGCYGIFDDLG